MISRWVTALVVGLMLSLLVAGVVYAFIGWSQFETYIDCSGYVSDKTCAKALDGSAATANYWAAGSPNLEYGEWIRFRMDDNLPAYPQRFRVWFNNDTVAWQCLNARLRVSDFSEFGPYTLIYEGPVVPGDVPGGVPGYAEYYVQHEGYGQYFEFMCTSFGSTSSYALLEIDIEMVGVDPEVATLTPTATTIPATATAQAEATATAQAEATATATYIAGLPPATQTAIADATATSQAEATSTAIAALPEATQTAIADATATSQADATATAQAFGTATPTQFVVTPVVASTIAPASTLVVPTFEPVSTQTILGGETEYVAGESACYVLLPGTSEDGVTVFGYTIAALTFPEFELCTTEYSFDLVIFGWDFGAIAIVAGILGLAGAFYGIMKYG